MSDDDDDRQEADTPPDEPAGLKRVEFNVPIPTSEQISGEIARQILAANYGRSSQDLVAHARKALDELISNTVAGKAASVIETMLAQPMRPTDAFGNPIGEPTTLRGALARRVTDWCNDVVDSEGKPTKGDGYNSSRIAPRINWLLGRIVHGELQKLVDAEVKRIIEQLKASATQKIAVQIAEQVSKLVLK